MRNLHAVAVEVTLPPLFKRITPVTLQKIASVFHFNPNIQKVLICITRDTWANRNTYNVYSEVYPDRYRTIRDRLHGSKEELLSLIDWRRVIIVEETLWDYRRRERNNG